MSSDFPLFRLPSIVLNHGLKLMAPFEILCLSLCSKRCKTVCQSLRNQLKCKEKAVKFQLKFSKKREIRLEFNYYPSTRWIFELDYSVSTTPTIQRKSSDKHEFLEAKFAVRIPNWNPTETDHNTAEEKRLKFYVPMEYGCFGFRTFVNHLSYIFNITLTDLELHFQDFTRDENAIIIDLYCRNWRNTNYVKALILVGDSENTPDDDEVVYHIVNRQEAKSELTLDIQGFTFDISRCRYSPNQLVIRNPNWVGCTDIENFNSFSVLIFSAHSIMWLLNMAYLIEMWCFGWTPKWTVMMIEFLSLDIDDCINGLRERISAGVVKIRSEETIEGPDGLSHRIKYSFRRGDGTIGEFLVENNKYLYIKARENTDISLSTFISLTKSMM
ncbi:hypothetical protein GCK72_000348 [Caenorhabditis remanei]|uniref:F-box domain-containing protein n=1 Tax=Caenorhabditis remanei TaxID=31234 RepID=A0A6A5HPE0_CAERE|nr:hypothetical protein GCK72_000348 [Caenorhabditis remanei]KAF1768536.1 hypothetical protein GCK72_000348 [Caenorhabditis remanei]